MVDHARLEDLLLGQRPAAPRVRIQRTISKRLGRDLRQRRLGDAVLAHVALDLHCEELGREHQPGLAVPLSEPPVLGQRIERAARMLVEAHHQREVGCARDEHRVRGGKRGASGGASVLHVDERDPGEPEGCHRRVGVTSCIRAAGCEVDLAPAHAGVGKGGPRGDRGHRQPGHAGMTPEGVDPRADDSDAHAACSEAGAKAKVTTPSSSPGAGINVNSIGIPMLSSSGSATVSLVSTRTSPGSSTYPTP